MLTRGDASCSTSSASRGGGLQINPDGTVSTRTTKQGKPAKSGLGYRPHECRALSLLDDGQSGGQSADESPRDAGESGDKALDKPAPIPEFVREVACHLGWTWNVPDYHDWTGTESGPTRCGICNRSILVAFHIDRPDGRLPLILETVRDNPTLTTALAGRSPWRAYQQKGDASNTILATWVGSGQKIAQYFNHRHVCPETRPMEQA